MSLYFLNWIILKQISVMLVQVNPAKSLLKADETYSQVYQKANSLHSKTFSEFLGELWDNIAASASLILSHHFIRIE